MREFFVSWNGEKHKTFIDDEDIDLLKYSWFIWNEKYKIQASTRDLKGKTIKITLHRVIADRMGYRGKYVKHLNGNMFDNTRSNIVIKAPKTRKYIETEPKKEIEYRDYKKLDKKSKYIGVEYHPYGSKNWRSRVKYNGKVVYSAYFYTEIEAAKSHDREVVKYHGSTGLLNFPDDYPNPDEYLIVQLPKKVLGKRFILPRDDYPDLSELLED